MAFIQKYLTAWCICQPKVAARKKKKDYRPKLTTSQNWLPVKNGCQPIKGKTKMAVKIAGQKKVNTSQNWLPAKSNYQPNVNASQKLLTAKHGCQQKTEQCKLKVAASKKGLPAKVVASQMWLPAKCGCLQIWRPDKSGCYRKMAAIQKIMLAYSGNWI